MKKEEIESEFKKMVAVYSHIKSKNYDHKIRELKKDFKKLLKRIKLTKKNDSLINLYKEGIELSDRLAEMISKKSILSSKKFIDQHIDAITNHLHNKEYESASKELKMLKKKLLLPPVRYHKVQSILINKLRETYERTKDNLFYRMLLKQQPVEIIMDKDVAVVSGKTVNTFASSMIVNRLSKMIDYPLKVNDVPLYITIDSNDKYINLTIIERNLTKNGLIANRHFIRIPNNFKPNI